MAKADPLPHRTSQVPRDEAWIVCQLAAVHVDQIEQKPVCGLDLEVHSYGPLEEVSWVSLVVWKPVHLRAFSAATPKLTVL